MMTASILVLEEPYSAWISLLMMAATATAVGALVVWLLVLRARDASASIRDRRKADGPDPSDKDA